MLRVVFPPPILPPPPRWQTYTPGVSPSRQPDVRSQIPLKGDFCAGSLVLRPRTPLQWRWRGHRRRGEEGRAKAAPERSRAEPPAAAPGPAEHRASPLSRVLSGAARQTLSRVLSGALPAFPLPSLPREGRLASPTNSPQVPGYFIGQPYRPTPHGVQKKKKATNSESWKNVQRQRARSLRVGNDRFLQVRLGFTGGVVGTGCWRAGLPFPPHARGTAPRQSLSR